MYCLICRGLIAFGLVFYLKGDGRPAQLHPIRFGVIIYNPSYQIYRSEALGTKGLELLFELTKKFHLKAPQIILHLHRKGHRKIAQASEVRHSDYAEQEKTGAEKSNPFAFEFLESYQGNSVYLPAHTPDDLNRFPIYYFSGHKQGRESFYRALEVILTASCPILFHCKGGRHRTGMMAMIVRYLMDDQMVVHTFYDQAASEYRFFAQRIRPEVMVTVHSLMKQPMMVCLREHFHQALKGEVFLDAQSKKQHFEFCQKRHQPMVRYLQQWDTMAGQALLEKKKVNAHNLLNQVLGDPMVHPQDQEYLLHLVEVMNQ